MLSHCLGAFGIGVVVALQQVGEKENPEHDKEDEQFQQDDEPQRAAHRPHGTESVVIEAEHSAWECCDGG